MSSINEIVRKLRESRVLTEREDYSKKDRDELISLAQGGDQLAVETLIKTHDYFIRNMCKKYFLSGYDEEDILQLATVAFWQAVMDWDMTGNFEAFAGMLIKRRLVKEMDKVNAEKRKSDTTATSIDDPIADDDEGGVLTIGDTIASDTGSAEEEYLGHKGADELLKFMEENLSDSERECIKLYIQGYKVSKIAEVTGLKYKAAENALRRVKNKVSDFLRTRESKKIREDKEGIEFTDEEKKVLTAVLSKIDKKAVDESAATNESYEEYSDDQFEDALEDIKSRLGDIIEELRYTDYDDRDGLMDGLEHLQNRLLYMEEYIPDSLYDEYKDLVDEAIKAENTEYIGPETRRDPYRERGLNRSDFY